VEAEAKRFQPALTLAGVRLSSRAAGLILLGLALVAGALLLTWVLHDAPFVMDEWSLMLWAQNGSLDQIFTSWNGHLLAFGLAVAHLSILLVGPSYSLLIAIDIAGVLACSVLVYVFARRRVGPILAAVPAMVPLFFSGSSEFFGTGIQLTPLLGINGIYSLNFGLAALLLLERNRRREDIGACLMLCLSISAFSYGFAFMVGTAVAIALTPERWRRAYVVAIPAVLYGLWRIRAGDHGGGDVGLITLEHIAFSPLYVADSLAAVSAGLFGLATVVGRGPAVTFATENHSLGAFGFPFFLIVAEVTVIVCVARALGKRGLTRPSLWPPLVTLVALWSSQAVVMDPLSRMPGDPRYLFAGVVLLAVVASEAARGIKLSRLSIAMVFALALAGAVANLPRFEEGKTVNDHQLEISQAAGAMIQLAGRNADPSFIPAGELPEVSGTMWISVGEFQRFARNHGALMSMPLSKLRSEDNELRANADLLLAQTVDLRLTESAAATGASCTRLQPGNETPVDPGTLVLSSAAGAEVTLRRFSDTTSVSLGDVPAGAPRKMDLPPDRLAGVPWVLINDNSSPLTLCRSS
jgi:hypothetical protein